MLLLLLILLCVPNMTRSLSERIAKLSKKAQKLFITYGINVVLIVFGPKRTIPIVYPNETKARASFLWYVIHKEDKKV